MHGGLRYDFQLPCPDEGSGRAAVRGRVPAEPVGDDVLGNRHIPVRGRSDARAGGDEQDSGRKQQYGDPRHGRLQPFAELGALRFSSHSRLLGWCVRWVKLAHAVRRCHECGGDSKVTGSFGTGESAAAPTAFPERKIDCLSTMRGDAPGA
ncbi:protein of unknown function [Streptomyces sp. KY75]|nr:protein of unknown function [Streptomyces sp. KY70]CAD5976005.1 protein of unknown function [Streptomyces sp. KY75]